MIKVQEIKKAPVVELPYLTANRGETIERSLPVQVAVVEGLPETLDAIALTADLQAHERAPKRRLMGEVVAEVLPSICREQGLRPERVGVVLAGDFFALPDLKTMGGYGDIEEIWLAFADAFRWVTGVAGNHDRFMGRYSLEGVFDPVENVHPLDGDFVELDGVRIGGVSGIIGNSKKPWRRTESRWRTLAEPVLAKSLDLFVLHQGPDAPIQRYRGHSMVRDAIYESHGAPLVVFGHCYWPEPWVRLPGGAQALNVDSRAVLLVRG